ncbi:MAG TPA: hypothetical protein GXZ90_07635 [Clostridiales bacterium]|nr:hypothetical protein [Clostridiales bacterium]
MENNILSSGIEAIESIKQEVIMLNDAKSRVETLKADENHLQKELQILEKSIEDEITLTTKKRKKEVEEAYDSQLSALKEKKKKIKDKRQKNKSKKVNNRIADETSLLIEENRQINKEIKRVLKQDKVPRLVNTRLFYAVYKPKEIVDILIIISTFIIALLLIPSAVYYFLYKDGGIKALITIYFIDAGFFTFIYLLLQHFVKEKHPEAIDKIKGLRNDIKSNKKIIRMIKKKIVKDKDDSPYGLEKFDKEIGEIEKDEMALNKDKKDAIIEFTNNTSKVIAVDINNFYSEKLQLLNDEYKEKYEELRSVEDRIKNLTVNIAKNYEPYMGNDLLNVDKLDGIILIMKENPTINISEAINLYKNQEAIRNQEVTANQETKEE